MRLAWLLVCCALAAEGVQQCGVTPQWEREIAEEAEQARRLQSVQPLARNTTLAPIRMMAYYSDMTAMDASVTARIQGIIMPGVLKWFNNLLSVYSLAENWKMPQANCTNIMTVPTLHMSPGLPGIDLVVYVSAINDSSKNYISKGGYCALDTNTAQNPLAGLLLINAAYYSGLSREKEISVLRHEIVHILGFSSSLFSKFRQANGSLYVSPTVSQTVRDSMITMLTTPKVVSKARAAYGCDSLTGMELENYGGAGSASSHWEKRNVMNDFMVSSIVLDAVYSDISLAVLEDSGWYSVNYTYTDPLVFARGKGCDFLTMKCVIAGAPQFADFCVTPGNNQCSPSFTHKASCNIANLTSTVPAAYQYFANPQTAGTDASADYCPYREPFEDGDCKNRSSVASFYQPVLFGEQLCDSCMCFTGTYLLQNRVISNPLHYGCHNVTCDGGVAKVKVASNWVTCPVAGGQVTGIPGYSGYITCPSYDRLCGDRPCINGCFGYGICVAGNCQCNDGYSAIDCSLICDKTCRKCSGTSAGECTSCYANAHLSAGNCLCDSGFYRKVDTSCAPCHFSCKECTSDTATSCTACKPPSALVSGGACICPDGFYMTTDATQCLSCPKTCATCNSASGCLSCYPLAVLTPSPGPGSCSCAEGMYYAIPTGCLSCNSHCRTCTGPSETDCVSCRDNAAIQSDGSCRCNAGFYMLSDLTCAACHTKCATCSGPLTTNCLSCKPATATVQGGACACPVHQYLSDDGAACLECDAMCQTCTAAGATSCSSCYSLGILAPISGPGQCSCTSGLVYIPSTGCQSCYRTCRECSGVLKSQCSLCPVGSALSGIAPSPCLCIDGYFTNSLETCSVCNSNCKTCVDSATKCLSCDDSISSLVGTECVCLAGLYKSVSGKCVMCDGNCATCSAGSSADCTSCGTNAMLVISPGACKCNSSFFPNPTMMACTPCHVSCKECNGPDSTNCIACFSPATLTATYSCQCPDRFYPQGNASNCQPCNSLCGRCSGPGESDCTGCLQSAKLLTSPPSSCICIDGFFPGPDVAHCTACDSSCGTCTRLSSLSCQTCTTGKFWVDNFYCSDVCPFGQSPSVDSCLKQSNPPFFRIQLDKVAQVISDTTGRTTTISGSSNTSDSNDPVAYYLQGFLFDGLDDILSLPPNSIDSTSVMLDSTNVIEAWIRPLSVTGSACVISKSVGQRFIFDLCVTSDNKLLFEFTTIDLADGMKTAVQSLSGGTMAISSQWFAISSRMVLTDKAAVAASISINGVSVASAAYSNAVFRDFAGGDKFVVGASTSGQSLKSFFKGHIAEITLRNSDSLPSSLPCPSCSSGGLTLSPCLASEYQSSSSCSPCLSSCLTGCIRGSDCRRNTDPLCGSFTSFVGCEACIDLASQTSGGCKCIVNAELVTDQCQCQSDYPRNGNQCGECRNYYDSSEVRAYFDASFLLLIVEFSRALSPTVSASCDRLFSQATLLKLGTAPTCTWASDFLSLSVLFGANPTILSEAISLRAPNLFANDGVCHMTASPLGPTVQYKFPLPDVTAVLVVPSSLSLPCSMADTLDFDASASRGGKGRPLNFTWTITSDPALPLLSKYKQYQTVEPIVKVPLSQLSAANLTVSVTVTNFLGSTQTVSSLISVTAGEAISLQIDGGNIFTMKSADSHTVSAIPNTICTSSSPLYFTWTYLDSVPATTLSNSTFLTSRSTYNAITIPANTLKPGVSYRFLLNATDDTYHGALLFTAITLKSDLIALLDRVDCDISTGSDFLISGAKSSDPDNFPEPLAFAWSCYENTTVCKDPAGAIVLGTETSANLTIPNAKLKPSATWNLTLTVSKDTRRAVKSVIVTIKANVTTEFLNTFPTPARFNPQVRNQIALGISSLPNTTFLWSQKLGKSLTLASPVTYPYITIGAYTMEFGVTYGFVLTATSATGSVSTAKLAIKANYPPCCGTSTISPTSGIVLQTLFQVVSTGWDDPDGDLPLSYTVFYLYKTTPIVTGSKSLSTSYSFKSGIGTYNYYVVIWDTYNTQTTVPLSSITAQLAARFLQSDNVLESFHRDISNQGLVFCMAAAYATVYQFESTVLAGILAAIKTRISNIPVVDPTEIDALLGTITVFFYSQELALTPDVARDILDVLETAVRKMDRTITEQQLESLARTINAFDSPSAEIVTLFSDFLSKRMAEATKALLPDESGLVLTGKFIQTFSQSVALQSISRLEVAVLTGKCAFPRSFSATASLTPDTVLDITLTALSFPNATSDEVSLQLLSSGRYVNYRFERLSSPEEVTVQSLTEAVRLSIPIRKYNESAAYECQYKSTNGDWRTDGVNMTQVAPSVAVCNVSHFSKFRVEEQRTILTNPPSPAAPSPSTPGSSLSSCHTNPAPIAISCCLLLMGLAAIAFFRLVDHSQSAKTIPQFTEANNELESMKVSQTERGHISSPTSTDGPIVIEYQPSFTPTFSRAFCETHCITGLWIHSSDMTRWSKMLLLTTAVLVEICIIGAFAEDTDEDSHSVSEIWQSYSESDGKAVLVALAGGLGLSILLHILFALAQKRHSEVGKALFSFLAVTIAVGFLLSAVSLTFVAAFHLCFQSGGRWAIGCLCAVIGEVFINQSLLATTRALVCA